MRLFIVEVITCHCSVVHVSLVLFVSAVVKLFPAINVSVEG